MKAKRKRWGIIIRRGRAHDGDGGGGSRDDDCAGRCGDQIGGRGDVFVVQEILPIKQ